MRRTLLIICLYLSVQGITFAQMPRWTSVKIPEDSIYPLGLNFYDSLNGYLIAYRTSYIYNGEEPCTFYFETTNGGRSWKKLTDSLLVGPIDGEDNLGMPDVNPSIVFGNLTSRYIYSMAARHVRGSWIEGSIIHTTDAGKHWNRPLNEENGTAVYPLHAIGNDTLLSTERAMLYTSYDGGKTYPKKLMDSTFLRFVATVIRDSSSPNFGDSIIGR
jgi:photosystem II stability/assembly factor-like uncharacterized protein